MSEQFPRDEWIVGEGTESPGRWYVLHARPPLFVVEVFDDDEVHPPLSWRLSNGQLAGNLVWLDDTLPTQGHIDAWMERLGEVLDDYDVRVERRIDRDREYLDEDDEC